jgi:SAM-dependent methyltransferase
MKIELGAGERPAPGFLAYDVNPRTADVVGSACDLPFRDGSIEALRAVDVAEHVSFRDTDRLFAEWARVCVPGAVLFVQVPSGLTICEWLANNDPRLRRWERGQECTALLGATWRLLGAHDDGKYVDTAAGDDWRWNAHYALFSAWSLRDVLTRSGFRVDSIEENGHPNLLAKARRLAA